MSKMTDTGGGINYALYRYTPSIPAAVIFAVLFILLSALHLIRLIKHRSYFFIPFLVGLLCKPPRTTAFLTTEKPWNRQLT